MIRYGVIREKNPREIVLLKGMACFWGKCAFCDYIADNALNIGEALDINEETLDKVTGVFGALEVINSGSVFELPPATLKKIKEIAACKNIKKLYFEAHYAYKDKLREIRDYFGIPIVFKCGVETFDEYFRNTVLNKGVHFKDPAEAAKYMDSICLMVGIKGQTREMIRNDISLLLKYFKYGCVNVYNNNTTGIKSDPELADWFKNEFSFLEDYENIDVLWEVTDFGVGGNDENRN